MTTSETIEARLQRLGLTLPVPAAPAANYVPALEIDGQVFVSGQLPMGAEGLQYKGKLGDEVSLEDGRAAARLAALNVLAQLKATLGDLERIRRCLRVVGYVNATPEFGDHPAVINGASDLLAEVLGERGHHPRAAIGCASLPFNAAVEVEALFAVAPEAERAH